MATEVLPDGVYVGLSEEDYFAQPRYGSTDVVRWSSTRPENWWYGSRHNPRRVEEEPDEPKLFGSALHTYLLEGHEVFLEKYCLSHFKSWSEAGARAWRASKRKDGVEPLKPESWHNVFLMGELIRNHPQMEAFFKGGISELTVLFTMDGIPMRARFDKLLMGFIMDLKTFGSHKASMTDEETVCDIVVQMKYDVQRFLYDYARHQLIGFVNNGQVHGATADQLEWLTRLANRPTWRWCWIFYQKVNNSGKSAAAPIVTPLIRDHQDATWVRGQERTIIGLENFKRLRDQFGLDRPWGRINAALNPDDSVFAVRYDHFRNRIIAPEEIDDAQDVSA
jgi:hypothetical protein